MLNVQTLSRTGGFLSKKTARLRILQTTQFVLEVTKSLQSIQPPHGEGFASSVRVRLVHASVRSRILHLAEVPGYYDVSAAGIPINDLDCIATISSFSAVLMWISLPRQGIFPKENEKNAFVALFRYIAYLMGTPTSPFESPLKAQKMMESLLMSEIKPSVTSRVLANNVLDS